MSIRKQESTKQRKVFLGFSKYPMTITAYISNKIIR